MKYYYNPSTKAFAVYTNFEPTKIVKEVVNGKANFKQVPYTPEGYQEITKEMYEFLKLQQKQTKTK